jgi:hypothetical protein
MQASLREGGQLPRYLVTDSVWLFGRCLDVASIQRVEIKRRVKRRSCLGRTVNVRKATAYAVDDTLGVLLINHWRTSIVRPAAAQEQRRLVERAHKRKETAVIPGLQDRIASQKSDVSITMLPLTADSRLPGPLMRSAASFEAEEG